MTQFMKLLEAVRTKGDRSGMVQVTVSNHALLRFFVKRDRLPSRQVQGIPFGHANEGDRPVGYLAWNRLDEKHHEPVILAHVEWPQRHNKIVLQQGVTQFIDLYCQNTSLKEEERLLLELWETFSGLLPRDSEFAGTYQQRLQYLENYNRRLRRLQGRPAPRARHSAAKRR